MNIMKSLRFLITIGLVGCLATVTAQTADDLLNPPPESWPQLGRDAQQQRYSPLDQIDTDNVQDLQLAWARDLGFLQSHQGSPVVWDGTMYVSTQTGILALDAATGEEVWEYSAPNPGEVITDIAPRGSPIVFEGNVYANLQWGATVALDAETGEEIWQVAITNEELNEGFNSNPIFADGKLIVGTEGADSAGAPGKISAIDVENGEILWTFNVVPLSPDDPGYDTWTNPPSWEAGIGGASAWNAGAYDPETNTIVYGTGQPTPWDRLSERRANEGEPSKDLYSASFVALDAGTGELKWYHQVVPADEWDMDQHTVPIFADIEMDGETRHVAILATTTGYIVIVDADSGEFLAGHQGAERYTIHTGYEEDGTPIINSDARYSEVGEFQKNCPAHRWAHIAPGAFSPDTGLYYRPNYNACFNVGAGVLPDDWQPGERAWRAEVGPRTEEDWGDGPYGALTAFDPGTGEVAWEFGHAYATDTAPVVTAGNLVFQAGNDSRVRAMNATTGEVLWEQPVTTGSRAGTITYAVDGQQYVASLIGLASDAGTGFIPEYNPANNAPAPQVGNAALFVYTLP